MKVPVTILQGLAAAMAGISIAGCNFIKPATPTSDPNVQESRDPNVQNNAPGEAPPKICLPDACPACGRG
jgi:hypothetical protein